MTNDFKPDFSCIGQGEFFPVRMEEGERFGETLLVPARAVRSETQAAPIVTTCSETIGGDPSTALRLSYQVRVF